MLAFSGGVALLKKDITDFWELRKALISWSNRNFHEQKGRAISDPALDVQKLSEFKEWQPSSHLSESFLYLCH